MLNWLRNLWLAISTVWQGLVVTLRYWLVTYKPERGTFTEKFEYPEKPVPVAARYRGFHRFDLTTCIACDQCAKACPVDCIYKVAGEDFAPLQSWCEIDVERCVGCEVCVHIPTKKTDPYELTVCPWNAIEMVPTVTVAHEVANKGGPPEYLRENWERVVEPAIRMAELAQAQA